MRMGKYILVITIWLSILLVAPFARASAGQKYTLDNGMTVVIQPMPKSPTVSIYALVKTGSATEGKYLGTGISHFVEHMLFKGTKKRPVGRIPAEVKALGGKINASTGFDYTIYTLDVPSTSFVEGLDIISDMITRSVFDPSETVKEQEVIVGEMRMINDRPERKLGDLLFRNVYLKHPYHHPIIGYPALFKKITPEELVDYYRTHYVPNNIIFVVAGNIDGYQVLSEIQKAFEGFHPQPYLLRNLPMESSQSVGRYREIGYPSQTTRIAMAYQSISATHPDMMALDVLAIILGQGESSRLYQEVIKKRRAANSVGASNYTPMDQGVFEISGDFEEGNVDEFVATVKYVIKQVQDQGVSREELDKAIHQIASALVFGQQVSSSVAYNSAVNEFVMGDFNFDQKYLEQVKKLTVQDIQRVAREYLQDERLTVVVLKPQDQLASTMNASKTETESAIAKEVLDNGLTVLAKEDHRLPLATVFVTMRAGSRQELEGQNGLNQLTADLWSKAAGLWNSTEFARLVESRGAVISSSGGYNSLNLRLDFLSDDLTFALDIVEACLKNPRFDEEDFKRQKDLNIATIKQQDDRIVQTALRQLRGLVFTHHPLRMDVSGTIKDIQMIQRDDVRNFYQQYLSSENVVVSFYGDIDQSQVLGELRKRLSSIPRKTVDLKKDYEDFPREVRQKNLTMDKEQAAVVLGFRAPDIYSADRSGMEIISSILGSSLNGRLFVKVREQLGKAYTLGALYYPSLDAGLIVFYVLTTNEETQRVKDILVRELQSLTSKPVSLEEINTAKAALKGQFDSEMQTVGQLASVTALDELYGLGFNHYHGYVSRINQVTVDEIQRISQKYLNPSQASWVIIQSSQKK